MSKLHKLITILFITVLGIVGLSGIWWIFSDYDTHSKLPWPATWLFEKEKNELNQRAQVLYDSPNYTVLSEMKNSLFTRMFRGAKMYAVWQNYHTQPPSGNSKLMVTYKNIDYRMPSQFNELMFATGQELNPSTQDNFAYALIIAALPPTLIDEKVDCQEGEEIYENIEPFPPFTYEIHCQIPSYNYSMEVKFTEYRDQFQGGSLSVSDESGDHMFGYNFGPNRAMIDGE